MRYDVSAQPMPLRLLRFVTAFVAVLAVSACRDAGGPSDPDVFEGTVSEPVAASHAPVEGSRVLGAGRTLDPEAFVSLAPGSAVGATAATITNERTGQLVTTVVVDGGFDPVGIRAVAGDVLGVAITLANGGLAHARAVVPDRKAPRVVRTRPAAGRTDVALNSVVVVVFTEPIDPATVTASSLRLLAGGSPVAGTWQPVGEFGIGMQFFPAEPLAPNTGYQVVVSTELTDVGGDPLEAPLTAEFTTGSSASAPLTVPPEGSRLIFTAQPTEATVLTPFAPAVTVTLVDALGATVTEFAGEVTLELDQATNELWELGGVSIWGITGVHAVGGIATFSDVSVNVASTGYTLSAVAEPAVSATSEAFAVLPSPWVSKPFFSDRRLGGATTAVSGGRVYFIGGFYDDQGEEFVTPTKVEAFDPATNSWNTVAPLPFGRIGAAAAELGGLIYVVGGAVDLSSGPIATVQAYDPTTDRWTERSPMATPRLNAAVAVVNGTLYAIGGSGASGALGTVEAYDPVTNSWSVRASMPTPRSRLAATSVNGVIYAVGGTTGDLPWSGNPASTYVPTVEAYDAAADAWTVRVPLTSPRIGAGAAAVDGLVYSIGGWGGPLGEAPMADVESYNPTTGSWTRHPSLPMLGSTVTAVTHGVIYAVVDARQFYALEP